MIDTLTHLIFIIVAWLIFGLAGRRHADLILAVGGATFLAFYAPIGLAWIAFTSLEASLLFALLRRLDRGSNLRQYLPYILFPNLLFVDLHPNVLQAVVETTAITFSITRIFMTTKQLLAARKEMAVGETRWIWVAAFYLPALIVGPVFSGTDLRNQAKKGAEPDTSPYVFRMLLAGFVTVWLINPALLQLGRLTSPARHSIDLGIEGAPLYFLILFTGFYGQSLVAEYSSRLFGRTLPYNFDKPWLARNIRDFWGRWHRSMADFVMQYIFLPLNLKGVSARLATIAAFTFMGLWHNLSLGYLLWGIAHGSLLAFWPKEVGGRFGKLLERIVTWAAVMGLSYMANYSWLA